MKDQIELQHDQNCQSFINKKIIIEFGSLVADCRFDDCEIIIGNSCDSLIKNCLFYNCELIINNICAIAFNEFIKTKLVLKETCMVFCNEFDDCGNMFDICKDNYSLYFFNKFMMLRESEFNATNTQTFKSNVFKNYTITDGNYVNNLFIRCKGIEGDNFFNKEQLDGFYFQQSKNNLKELINTDYNKEALLMKSFINILRVIEEPIKQEVIEKCICHKILSAVKINDKLTKYESLANQLTIAVKEMRKSIKD